MITYSEQNLSTELNFYQSLEDIQNGLRGLQFKVTNQAMAPITPPSHFPIEMTENILKIVDLYIGTRKYELMKSVDKKF